MMTYNGPQSFSKLPNKDSFHLAFMAALSLNTEDSYRSYGKLHPRTPEHIPI